MLQNQLRFKNIVGIIWAIPHSDSKLIATDPKIAQRPECSFLFGIIIRSLGFWNKLLLNFVILWALQSSQTQYNLLCLLPTPPCWLASRVSCHSSYQLE
jgi:hypothetical protein